ncbi:MAG: TolC family protein, partial [Bacteroidota bacterium]|nr:TolC family protein [Bacteroidota bacterium]
VEQAEENYRLTADKFKEGLALNSDLLDAETSLLQANTNYIQSIADFNISKAKLEKAIGQ